MAHVGRLEMYVDSTARGQGVGRCLVEAAMGWAEANPLLSKVGLSVFEDNARAVALYEHFGFVPEGRRVGEYREPTGVLRNDLLMCRRV
jgi:ribosomal protein S18 acetylase RimI-like enzyme